MPRHHATFPVPNPVDDAFAFVQDFRNAARWDPQVTVAEKVTPGPIEVGSRFVLRSRFLGMTIQLPYTMVELETNRRLVLAGKNWLFTYRDEITFASEGEGSRLTYDATLSLRGLLAIGNPILGTCLQISRRCRCRRDSAHARGRTSPAITNRVHQGSERQPGRDPSNHSDGRSADATQLADHPNLL